MILAKKSTKLSLGYKCLEIIQTNKRKENILYFYSIEFVNDGFSEVPLDTMITEERRTGQRWMFKISWIRGKNIIKSRYYNKIGR